MGVTEYYTPGYGIVVSMVKDIDLIKKLFDFRQDDEYESPDFTNPSRDGNYVALNLPHDVCEELSSESDSEHFVFIGVVDKYLETPYGFGARRRRENYKNDEDKPRLEFGEGKYINWNLFKKKYDELEKELKARYVEIEGYGSGLVFIPDDCLCCT